MTLAPQSASWRTQVGPERTRVRSSTVKRERAWEALGNGIATAPTGLLRPIIAIWGPTFPDLKRLVHQAKCAFSTTLFIIGRNKGYSCLEKTIAACHMTGTDE